MANALQEYRSITDQYALQMGLKRDERWSGAAMWCEMAIGAVFGGMFVASALCGSGIGMVIAAIILMVGKGLLLLGDLGKPGRFLKVFSKPGTSWLARGAWGFLIFCIAAVVLLVGWFLNIPALFACGKCVGAVAAAVVMFYGGFVMLSSKSIDFWKTGNLPALYFASALSAGIGAVAILNMFAPIEAGMQYFAMANLAVLAVLILSFWGMTSAGAHGSNAAAASVKLLTKGDCAFAFAGLALVVGAIAPFCATLAAVLGVQFAPAIWAIVGLCQVVGCIALRYCMLSSAIVAPQM